MTLKEEIIEAFQCATFPIAAVVVSPAAMEELIGRPSRGEDTPTFMGVPLIEVYPTGGRVMPASWALMPLAKGANYTANMPGPKWWGGTSPADRWKELAFDTKSWDRIWRELDDYTRPRRDIPTSESMLTCPACHRPVPYGRFVDHFHDHAVLKGAK